MGLHVGILRAEELFARSRPVLDDIGILAAAVVALLG